MGRKRKIENRDAILQASYRLFMTRGYDNVTSQDIEQASEIHKRNLYRYFKNKDEVLGAIIEAVEKQMLEYLRPALTDDSLLMFTLFSLMKHEYAIGNPDYFRMRASLIARPDTFIRSFMTLYELSYPQKPDWKSDERTMLQGLYILGGTHMVQYGFIKNLSGNILSDESADFLTNYDMHELSEHTAISFRRFMDYAIRNNLHILGLSETEVDSLLENAYTKLDNIDVNGFRQFYEKALGFNKSV